MNTNTELNNNMMTEKKEQNKYLFSFLYLLVILCFTFLPLRLRLSFINDTVLYVFGVTVSLMAAYSFVRTRRFVFAFIYASVIIINFFLKNNINLGNSLAESFNILCTAFMAHYLLNNLDMGKCRWFSIVFIALVAVYAISTFGFYLVFPGVMRFAAMRENFDRALPFFLRGLSPYAFPHALTCVIPAMVMGLKIHDQSTTKKVLCAATLALSIVLIYITQATGALIAAVFALVCSIVSKADDFRKNRRRLIWVSIFILPFALSDSLQLSFLQGVGELVGSESHYALKINEMEESITSEGETSGDINYRGNLLELTMKAIATHPLFGVTDSRDYGHHNALPDRWALYGIIGFLPLILYFFYQVKYTLRIIPIQHQTFYLIGVATNFLMLLSKDMLTWYQLYCFIVMLPVMTLYFGNTNKLRNEYNKESQEVGGQMVA